MYFFLVTPCLEVAVQPCMDRVPIEKKVIIYDTILLLNIMPFLPHLPINNMCSLILFQNSFNLATWIFQPFWGKDLKFLFNTSIYEVKRNYSDLRAYKSFNTLFYMEVAISCIVQIFKHWTFFLKHFLKLYLTHFI